MTYINVKLDDHSADLSDRDLLLHIHSKIQAEDYYYSMTGDMDKVPQVVSIWVPACIDTHIGKQNDALAQVSRWIRDVSTKGLPYNRNHLYRFQ